MEKCVGRGLIMVGLAVAVGACAKSTALPTVAASAGSLETDRAIAAALTKKFDAMRYSLGMPGLAVAILRDTTVLAATGFGFADVEKSVPVTRDTPFNVASVSKPISAVAALQLVESGKLNLDRPMTSFTDFAEFCANARETGGIFFSNITCDSSLTLRRVLSMEANGEPGTRFYYNPPMYSWASRPIAEVAGIPFSDLVTQSVLIPAGMTRSARQHRRLPLRADLAAELAVPYHDSSGRFVRSQQPAPQGDGAAGGVISTVSDLAKFDIALSRNRLISAQSRELMWTPGRTSAGNVLPYGLGWFVANVAGEKVVWHTGLWEGAYSALYMKMPERKLTLILLANSDKLQWETRFDEAAIERSPFAMEFLRAFASDQARPSRR